MSRPTPEEEGLVLADEPGVGERVRALEVQMIAVNADVAELFVQVQGPPRNESIRGRLHTLESSQAAASAAEAALIVAKQLRDERSHRAWTIKEKALTLVLAVLAIGSPWAMFLLTK